MCSDDQMMCPFFTPLSPPPLAWWHPSCRPQTDKEFAINCLTRLVQPIVNATKKKYAANHPPGPTPPRPLTGSGTWHKLQVELRFCCWCTTVPVF